MTNIVPVVTAIGLSPLCTHECGGIQGAYTSLHQYMSTPIASDPADANARECSEFIQAYINTHLQA